MTWDLGEHDERHGTAGDLYSGYPGGGAQLAVDLGITAQTTDDELTAIAERETDQAAAQDPPQIVTGILDYLRDVRDRL